MTVTVSSPPKSLSVSRPTLGQYRLISRIAVGGMAEIFVARMEGYAGADRLCVIKKMSPRIKADPRAVQMFLDEARIAATLQHPNIVQMFEVGEMGSDYFIAMEYLHGEDMRTVNQVLLKQGLGLPLENTVKIIIDLLAGLHHAHEKCAIDGHPLGIVHRDVSPHNLFVTYDGAVKIVDFGIAKASNREHQTKIETLKGKIQYMSPEQCRCVAIDRRSDLFSVGVVLYELSTGCRLNGGNDEYEIMKRTVEGPIPRPSERVAGYPRQLEDIVRMALEKDPNDRFQTALEMQQALENFAHEHRLRCSAIGLSKFMHRLFAERIETWQRGLAGETSIRELVAARHQGPNRAVDLGPSEPIITLSRLTSVNDAVELASSPTLGGASSPPLPSTPEFAPSPTSKRRKMIISLALVSLVVATLITVLLSSQSDSATNEFAVNMTPSDAVIDSAPSVTDASVITDASVVTADAVVAPPSEPSDSPTKEWARLRIRGTKGADVYINGRKVGTSPITMDRLDLKTAVVELRKSGFKRTRKRISLRPGKTRRWTVSLEKESPSIDTEVDTRPGDLRIRSTPSVLVYVDGIKIGYSSLSRQFTPGRHRVRLSNSRENISESIGVTVFPGKATKVVCKRNDQGAYQCQTR